VGCGDVDPPLADLARLADALRAAGTCRVALTGGEPLLRDDLPAVVAACGPELSPVLFTSGYGLDSRGAGKLRQAGLAAVYVSLDHFRPEEHDRIRGQAGAHAAAVEAMRASRRAGLFTAAQAVVGADLLGPGRLEEFLAFCRTLSVDEVMLLEEVPVGSRGTNGSQPAAESDEALRETLAAWHLRSARDAALPKVSSMSWLESPACLGCQAGFSFLYVSAGGDVTPCDFVPVSFGNVHQVGLAEILHRMASLLRRPSGACLARRIGALYCTDRRLPVPWEEVSALLESYDPGPPPQMLSWFTSYPTHEDACRDCQHQA